MAVTALRAALGWRLNRLRRRSPQIDWICWRYQARSRVVEVSGIRLRIGSHLSPPILGSVLDGDYEGGELELLRSTLAPDDVVMELGTGLGFLATFSARQIGSERVVTYEGNPYMERYIRETFALNRVSPRLEMSLVGPEPGRRPFYVPRDFWASSMLKCEGRATEITVPVRAFNVEAKQLRPTLLIVDIEGGEVELVPKMDLGGVRAVVIELHERVTGRAGAESVKAALVAAGFREEASIGGARCLFTRPGDSAKS